MSEGCGLVAQGTHQAVKLGSTPSGASAEFDGKPTTTPGVVQARRKSKWSVFRASKPGRFPACAIFGAPIRGGLLTWDILMVGLPLLVDLPLGTLRAFPDDLQLLLPPLDSGEKPYVLPPDAEILAAFHRERINLCDPFRDGGPLRDARDRVLVTSGPLPGDHEVLGPVDAGVAGFDKTSFFFYHGIGVGQRVFRKATPTQRNMILASLAILKYGTAADGVINVNYESDPANDVFATGLAVRAPSHRWSAGYNA